MKTCGSFPLALVLTAALGWGADEYRPASPEPTPEETQVLEYLNRFRANPQAEMERIAPANGKRPTRMSGVDWDMFRKEMEALKPAPPLVFNLQLLDAARKHSHYMILNELTHVEDPGKAGFTGKTFGERCKKAGYTGGPGGENCYRDAGSTHASHAGFVVDFGQGPGGMQPGRGHRTNMMNPGFREIGCSAVPHGQRLSVTHDFGSRRVAREVGGVVFMDKNGNGFYDLDEGLGNIRITADDGSGTVTWASGAFTLDLKSANTVTLKAEYQGLTYSRTFEAGKQNLKFDWIVPTKEAVEQADKLLAQLDAVKDPKSPACFAALVALHLGTHGLGLDPERRAKIDGLTGQVKTDLEAHQRAVLEALRNYDPLVYPKTIAEHRKPYGGTVAANWFREAELAGNAKNAVNNFEKNVAGTKVQPSVRKALVQPLEAAVKELKESVFRSEMEGLLERAKAAGV